MLAAAALLVTTALHGDGSPPPPFVAFPAMSGDAGARGGYVGEYVLALANATLKHTISGFSSGGGMVANHLVAFSSVVQGAGIVAGNPYGCGSLSTASLSCNYGSPIIDLDALYSYTAARAKAGAIDATAHLRGKPVYVYSGTRDTIVATAVLRKTNAYFGHYCGAANVVFVQDVASQHGYITNNYGECCACMKGSWILNCNYDQPGAIFRHLLGSGIVARATAVPRANMKYVSQRHYAPKGKQWSSCQMQDHAFVYVPSGCAGAKLGTCQVHVNYHGCSGTGINGPRHVGYSAYGESNGIVIVYPQAKPGTGNPTGCWDWTGVTGKDFDTHGGCQVATVVALINDLASALAAGSVATDDDDFAVPPPMTADDVARQDAASAAGGDQVVE